MGKKSSGRFSNRFSGDQSHKSFEASKERLYKNYDKNPTSSNFEKAYGPSCNWWAKVEQEK